MVARVQHVVRDAGPGLAVQLELVDLQQLRQVLGLLDRDGAHQDRLAAHVAVLDHLDDRLVLLLGGPVDLVVVVDPRHRPIGGDLDHVHLVDVQELLGLGRGRPGHPRQLVVETEVVLDGHRGQGLVLGLDVGLFLGLDRLVQPLRQPPAMHHAAGELVDQDDLAIADDVVAVALIEHVGAQRLVDVVHHRDVDRIVEAGAVGRQVAALLQHLLDPLGAELAEHGLALLLVVLEGRGVLDQLAHQNVHGAVELRPVLGGARDDQRRAGLVDQDRVHLVDDGEVVPALGHLARVVGEVVAQVVEAEFVVGAVGDVGGVGALALAGRQAVDDDPDFHAEEAVDLPHPFGVALGQVVVDRDHVHALAGEGVQIDGQGGDQGLAFAGPHLGDAAEVQHHAADQLHVVMTLAQRALGGFAHGGEGLVQQIVEGLALGEAVAEFLGLGAQLFVGQGHELRLQGVDRLGARHVRLDLAVVGRAENLLGQAEHACSGKCRAAVSRPGIRRGSRTGFVRSARGRLKNRPPPCQRDAPALASASLGARDPTPRAFPGCEGRR